MKPMLTAETRLNKALALHPAVLEYVTALNPHDFERLRNPLMQRLMPPRITLGRIAAMTNVPVARLLEDIAALGVGAAAPTRPALSLPVSSQARPDWVAALDPTTVRTVDLLRIDESLDADPMVPVMTALLELEPNEAFRFRHKWEPQPLYDIWAKLSDIEWFAEQRGPDEWWIWLWRAPEVPTTDEC